MNDREEWIGLVSRAVAPWIAVLVLWLIWNHQLVGLFGLPHLTYWQALLVYMAAQILFTRPLTEDRKGR